MPLKTASPAAGGASGAGEDNPGTGRAFRHRGRQRKGAGRALVEVIDNVGSGLSCYACLMGPQAVRYFSGVVLPGGTWGFLAGRLA